MPGAGDDDVIDLTADAGGAGGGPSVTGVVDLTGSPSVGPAAPVRKRARAAAAAASDQEDAELAGARSVLSAAQAATAAPRSLAQVEADKTAIADALRKLLPCTICLDVITDMASTPCGHLFCMTCIVGALKATKRCPNCAQTVKLATVHRIFW